MVNQSEIKICKGCGARIYFSGSRFAPTNADSDEPHNCIVNSSTFRKTASVFSTAGHMRATEKAISNELDRLASKAVVSDVKLEKRIEALEKRVKELEDQLLEKHDQIMILKRQVERLNILVDSKPYPRGWCYALENRCNIVKGEFVRAEAAISKYGGLCYLSIDFCVEDEKRPFDGVDLGHDVIFRFQAKRQKTMERLDLFMRQRLELFMKLEELVREQGVS